MIVQYQFRYLTLRSHRCRHQCICILFKSAINITSILKLPLEYSLRSCVPRKRACSQFDLAVVFNLWRHFRMSLPAFRMPVRPYICNFIFLSILHSNAQYSPIHLITSILRPCLNSSFVPICATLFQWLKCIHLFNPFICTVTARLCWFVFIRSRRFLHLLSFTIKSQYYIAYDHRHGMINRYKNVDRANQNKRISKWNCAKNHSAWSVFTIIVFLLKPRLNFYKSRNKISFELCISFILILHRILRMVRLWFV